MSTTVYHITSLTQPLIRAQIEENIEAPRHWPLWVGVNSYNFVDLHIDYETETRT